MSEDIFISYRRKDASDKARLLKIFLEKCNYTVFMDQDKMSTLRPFPEELNEKIRECKDWIFILSPEVFNFHQEDYLLEEVLLAHELFSQGKIRTHIVATRDFVFKPSLLAGCPDRYAEVLLYFCTTNYERYIDFEGSDSEILARIKTHLHLFKAEQHFVADIEKKNEVQSAGYLGEVGKDREDRLINNGLLQYQYNKKPMEDLVERLRKDGHKLTVLDVGCSTGKVTHLYFDDDQVFEKVIGIDKNVHSIQKAQTENMSPCFAFEVLDLNDHLEEKLNMLCEKHSIEQFDIIFISHVLQHLPNREQRETVLNTLISFLRKGGCVIALNADDGTKMIYQPGRNNENATLINNIVEITERLPAMADLHYGRKLYSDLIHARLSDVRVYPITISSSMFSEQEKLSFLKGRYVNDFKWREDEFSPLGNDTPEKMFKLDQWKKEISHELKKIEQLLVYDGCWYSCTFYFGFGFKL